MLPPTRSNSTPNHQRRASDQPDTPLLDFHSHSPSPSISPEYFPYMFDTRRSRPSDAPSQSSVGRSPVDIKKRRLALLWAYAPDWILTVVIVGLFYLLDRIHGNWREFSLEDASIQHTFATVERVPPWALYIIAFVAPLILMPLVNVITVRSWWDWHNSWLGLILGLALTGSLTQVVKVTVGRPRPDLIDRCQPVAGAHNAPVYGLATASICTQTDMHILKDGFRSFFSGHSSLSFAGLGFLSWYLAGKLHLFDRKGHTGKAWLALSPLVGALMVAISRTMDNRHHWQDVTVGSIVGIALSYFSYRQYYPALTSPKSHLPYGPRIHDNSLHRRLSSSVHIPLAGPQSENAPRIGVSAYSDHDLEAQVHDSSSPEDEQLEMDGAISRNRESLEHIWRGDERAAPVVEGRS